jgi:IPT/TIG domain
MRGRCMLLAASVGLAGAWLPSRPAAAQGDDRADRDRDKKRDGNRDRGDHDRGNRDHDRGGHDHDRGDRDHGRGDNDRGDNDRGRGDHGRGDHDRGHRDRTPPMVRSFAPRGGAIGSQVTIRGRFPAGTRLLFGGVDVAPIRRDGGSITFVVPRIARGAHAIVLRAGGPDVTVGTFVVDGRDLPPEPLLRKARWDRSGWTLLGEKVVRGKRDRDDITVGRYEGRFNELMVIVEDGDIHMTSMEIVFVNGDSFKPSIGHFFREDQRSRAIDLPGDRRTIRHIAFRYGNLPGPEQARVQVWGRERAARVVVPDRPPPRPGEPYRHGPPLVTDFWPREGDAGTEVTIKGRRFTPDLDILFDNRVVTPTRRDDTLLTFIVPRHRGHAPIALRWRGRRDMPVGTFVVSRRQADRERERWRVQRRLAAERWWRERARRLARTEAEREAALRAEEERLARERARRQRERQAALRARWEQRFLVRDDVRAELALHADRTARLERMLRLAETGDFGGLVIRIRLLFDYEGERHQRRMGDLKAAYARR